MSSRKCAWPVLGILLVATWVVTPPTAFAQSSDTEVGEVSAYGGGIFGIGTHPLVGGGAGIAFSRYGMFLLDTSFMSLGNNTIQPWPPKATVRRSYQFDFGTDFHIRIPIKENWAPYAIAGVGLLWDMVRQETFDAHGLAVVNHYNQFNGALHTGAGLRYYIRHDWGIRPEFKVIVSKQTYYRMSVGIFYSTPPNWP